MIKLKLPYLFLLMMLCSVLSYAQTPSDGGLGFLVKAEELRKAGNLRGAIDEYNKAIMADPKNHEFVFRKGKTLIALQEVDNAIQCFEKAVELKGDYVNGYTNLAALYVGKKKTLEAIKCLDNAFKYDSDPKNKVNYKVNIIKILYKEGRFKEAGNHINDAKQVDADNVKVLYYDAKYNNSIGKYEAAKSSMLKATPMLKTDDPKEFAPLYFELGLAYYKLEQYDNASQAFVKANYGPFKYRIFEMTPQYFQSLALSYFKVYDMEESKALLETALKMKKDFSAAHELLVKIANTKTDKAVVINQLKMAIEAERDPLKRANKYGELAEHQFEATKYADAIVSADECLKVQPNNYGQVFIKSLSLHRMGKSEEAINALQTLIKYPGLDQETKAQYNFALGVIYNKTGNSKLALSSFKKAVYGTFKYAAINELKKGGEAEADPAEQTEVDEPVITPTEKDDK